MTTVRDVVEMGLRKIGVVDPNSEEIAGAVDAFNAMVSGWRLQGIDIWHVDQALGDGFAAPEMDASDFATSDQFPMPDAFRQATAFCLAEVLAPEYGKQFAAPDSLRQIRTAYATARRTALDPALTMLRARFR